MEIHCKYACSGQKVKCPECCEVVPRANFDFHKRITCQEQLVDCVRGCNLAKVRRGGMNAHLLNECEFREYRCVECGEIFKEGERKVHSCSKGV